MSSVAGNQYFTNVENLLGSLSQLNVANLKSGGDALVASNFSANGVVLNVTPNLTNLSLSALTLTAGATTEPAKNTYLYNSAFAGSGGDNATLKLPVAEAGASFVLVQAATGAGTNSIVIQTNTPSASGAEQDVFATGNVVTNQDSGDIAAEVSVAGENTLTVTFTGSNDTQLFDIGSRLVFTCVKTGEWNVNHELHLGPSATGGAVEGTLAFSTV